MPNVYCPKGLLYQPHASLFDRFPYVGAILPWLPLHNPHFSENETALLVAPAASFRLAIACKPLRYLNSVSAPSSRL